MILRSSPTGEFLRITIVNTLNNYLNYLNGEWRYTLKKKKKIHEEPGKKIYSTDESEQLIQEFNDDAFDGKNKVTIKGKGAISNQLATFLFEYLSGFNVPTHFLKKLSNQEMLIRSLDMIPIEVRMRNIAYGSLCKDYGIKKGTELSCPVREFYLKDDSRHNPMINESHIIALNVASADDLKIIERMASKTNAVLKSFFLRRQIKLVDLKLEFGRYKNKIMLGSEISLDNCQLLGISNETELQIVSGDGLEKYEQIRDMVFK